MTDGSVTVVRAGRTNQALGLLGLAAVVALVTVPWWATPGDMRLLVEALGLLALAQMWNLLAGYAGLVSIGQQAYIGLGAYAFYYFSDKLGLHPFLSVIVAGVAAGVIAIPTSALVFRLRGGYFAIGTWVVAEVFALLIINTVYLGGGNGVTVTSAARIELETRQNGTYWIAVAVGVGSVVLVYLVLRSRLGLALTAVRDSEQAAESLGVGVLRAKVIVYLVAAFGCGSAGALIYLNLLRIQPRAAFSISWTAFIIFIVVIGGIGTIEGPIVGTAVFFVTRELLADYGTWYLVALGGIAVIVMLLAPGGLWSIVQRRFDLRFFPVQRRVRLGVSPRPEPAPGGTVDA
jgi:branched-chain amino acid transport system permease protein